MVLLVEARWTETDETDPWRLVVVVRVEDPWEQAFWSDCLAAILVDCVVVGEHVLQIEGCCVDMLVRLSRTAPFLTRLRVGEVEDRQVAVAPQDEEVVHPADFDVAALHF